MARLTFAEVDAVLKYDAETGSLTWKERPEEMFKVGGHSQKHSCLMWNARYAGTEAFTARNEKGYRVGTVFYKRAFAHRIAWLLHYGSWPKQEIDHINGIPTDNRIENLRDVTNSENHRNCRRRKDNTSGITGVVWFKSTSRWKAQIHVNGQTKSVGYFTDFNDAVAARKKAEIKLGYHRNHGRD